MKRIGIITIVKVNNYGAELQAYATQRAMQKMGYEAELIDYLFYNNRGHIKEKCSMPFYHYPLKTRAIETLAAVIRKWNNRIPSRLSVSRNKRFDDFHNEYTRFSEKRYRRYSELYHNPPKYDAYCVGSDQVWNPGCYTNLHPYFLTFAPRDAVRFSYASSFGVSVIPEDATREYTACLCGLGHISVREPKGADIVKDLTGRDAMVVADPTLLLDRQEWSEVEKEYPGLPKRFVLVYELHPIPRLMEEARRIARRLGVGIVSIAKTAEAKNSDSDVIMVADAGPSEFVYMFHHAEFVVTNSFHGTAFSVNSRKDFICVLSKTAKNNSRQEGLLTRCGLTGRIVYDTDEVNNEISINVDYSTVGETLGKFVNDSKQYIREAMNDE